MYAIVEIGGQQHKVQKSGKIYVNRLTAKEGDHLEFDRVYLVEKDGEIKVGLPLVEGTRVAAKVLAHVKDDKVLVFKKKRRKGYKRLNGHRQYLTQLLIQGILAEGEALEIMEEEKELPTQEEANAEFAASEEHNNGQNDEESVEVEEAEVTEGVETMEASDEVDSEESTEEGGETGTDEEGAPKKKKKATAKKKEPAKKKGLFSLGKVSKKKKGE
jgi:large subunit ribosomal protein L21